MNLHRRREHIFFPANVKLKWSITFHFEYRQHSPSGRNSQEPSYHTPACTLVAATDSC